MFWQIYDIIVGSSGAVKMINYNSMNNNKQLS